MGFLPVCKYHVEVTTGDIDNADTQAVPYLCLHGKYGTTGNRALLKPESDRMFRRGQTDVFTIEAVQMMALDKAIAGHNLTEPGLYNC